MDIGVLKHRLDTADLDSLRVKQSNPQTISNLFAFKKSVEQLADIPGLAAFVQNIHNNPLYNQNVDAVSTAPQVIAQLTRSADELRSAAIGIREFLATSYQSERPESVVASIPANQDLAAVTQTLQDLDKALRQFVSEGDLNGRLEIEKWESGSLVVIIFLGTMSAVGAVARALKAAAIVYQEIQKGRAMAQRVEMLKQHVKREQMTNDLGEVISDAEKLLIKDILDRESRAVEREVFNQPDNERVERIKRTVRLLAQLFEKGTTIAPSGRMPKDEQDKFPDVNHLLTETPPIKQISDSPGASNEGGSSVSPPSDS